MYEQREIVLIPFPYTDLTAAKQRPALIISNDKVNQTPDRICCLVTSKESDDGIELKNTDIEGSLPLKSFVKPHRIFTVSSAIIKKRLCRITKEKHISLTESIRGLIE